MTNHIDNDLQAVISRLGLSSENGLYITSEKNWQIETAFPNRVKRLLERKIRPEAFFCFDNKPLILFFKKTKEQGLLHEWIWNFNESPIVIIVDKTSVEIFNGFNFERDTQRLQKLGDSSKLNDFSYFQLVTGRIWEEFQNELGYKNRVDYKLLNNIKSARELLLINKPDQTSLINAIIGKTIFVRFLIDRQVKISFQSDR